VLGVWRKKNRMAQFNGDRLDRILRIPMMVMGDSDRIVMGVSDA